MTWRQEPRSPDHDPEPFYQSFWRSLRWGAPEPNEDERSRLLAIEDLLSRCDLGERPRILDLGCGRGWLTRALAARGEVLGADVTAAAVERARELFPGLRFEQADVEGLLASHGEASFDLVVSSEVLEHVADGDKPAFLRGVLRLLRPGGHAVLTTPRGELWPAWRASRDWRQPVEAWVSEKELDRLAAAAGFNVVQRTRAHVYGITPASRVLASRPFRSLASALPVLERLSVPFRIYQVVLLRRSAKLDSSMTSQEGPAGEPPAHR
jgi:2-polyprenyl-3-methyl-5-hydroxy-6-metoxy-1,4-benzoquinol methylase